MIIQKWIESSFEKNGDRVALFQKDEKITYKELSQKCDRLAKLMQDKGVQVGDMVAIVQPRSMNYVIAELTCLLYGYGAVLLDSSYPVDRIDFCVENAGAKFKITGDVMTEAETVTGGAKKSALASDTPALSIYTSGSTGKPKGVLHDQESIGRLVDSVIDFTKPTSDMVFGIVAPFTFIAGSFEILKAICSGASLTIVSKETLMDPRELADFVEKNKITGIYMPPKVAKLFKVKGDTLREIIVASERVTDLYSDKYKIIVMYGLSETASAITGFVIDKPYDNTPIGKAMRGVNVYILNDNNEECEEGEICVSGHFMTGYIGMPEKTAETKVKNPFFEKDGHEYMIRTGDLGKRLPDGNILFVNRKDWMLKINGQRVEPGEIEEVIRAVPGVKDAAVKGFENKSGRTYICAYYVADDSVTNDAIDYVIHRKLPHYMHPEVLVKMDKFPVNANGKLNRLALEAPKIKTECISPENEQEELALKLAKKMLDEDDFGVTDNLQYLGMDSMKSMEYSIALQENGLEITVSNIMRHKNIREILKAENEMCWFLNPYDETLKTLVVSSGIVVLNPVLPLYQKLNDEYNILIIEPVQDHYEKELKGMKYDELIDLYMGLVQKNMPDMHSIMGFMGFSFGGELSAALACKYEELYGKKLPAIMGDTLAKLESEYLDRDLTENELPEEVLRGNKEKIGSFLYRVNIINSFGYGKKYACYDGDVVLIDAKKGYSEKREEIKLQNAKVRYKNLKIIPMDDYSHSELFRDLTLIDFYKKLLARSI